VIGRPGPRLTVVVAATASAEAVARTVASLGHEGRADDLEILVVAAADRVPRPFPPPPGAAWITAPPGSDVPRLRRLGLDAARGEIVAFTEDSCTLAADWFGAWLATFTDPRVDAATGPVAPAMGDRPVDWAVFFCEYAPFLPGPVASCVRLAGNNFALRRDPARRLDPLGVHESEAASAASHRVCVAAACAGHTRRYSLRESLRDRLRFGHDYGRRRASALPGPARLASFLVGPAVLVAQAARLGRNVARRPRWFGPFLEHLPLTLGLLTAWSVGEWLGWMDAAVRPLCPASDTPHETAAQPRGRRAFRAASRQPNYTGGRPAA